MRQYPSILRLFGVLAAVLLFASCSPLAKIEKSGDYQKKLAYANELYARKKYTQAHDLYESLLTVYKGTTQFENLYYRYAYSTYYMKDYVQAAFHFKNFVDYFPNSPHAAEMAFMQAYCFYKLSPRVELDQSNTEKAIAQMQQFIDTYPESDKVEEANKIIDACRAKLEEKEYRAAMLYYNLGYYQAAAITFNNVLLDYPTSPRSDEYKYWVIKSEYLYALNSIPSKQEERYNQVITDYLDFMQYYANSKYAKEATSYYHLAQQNLKSLSHE